MLIKEAQGSPLKNLDDIIIPPLNEVERGVYWNQVVRLSVCPSVDTTPLPLSRVQFFSDRGRTW